MDQLKNLADSRLLVGCIYCGGPEETREHVPPRIFLDSPFPENLPIVSACRSCNNSFSLDEEYVACLIECVLAGSTDPAKIRRDTIARALRRNPSLRSRIESSKLIENGQLVWTPEAPRVENVLRKIAVGHAAFELSIPLRNPCTSLRWLPLHLMTADQRDAFDSAHVADILGEIGSRGSQRTYIVQVTMRSDSGNDVARNLFVTDWVDVQEGRYRYLAVHDVSSIAVRMVIGNYLACEAVWDDDAIY